jgi:hypothetical protein
MPKLGLGLILANAKSNAIRLNTPLRVAITGIGNFIYNGYDGYDRFSSRYASLPYSFYWDSTFTTSESYYYSSSSYTEGPDMRTKSDIIGTVWNGKTVTVAGAVTQITISYSPQTFTYSRSVPTVAFTPSVTSFQSLMRTYYLQFDKSNAGSYSATILGDEYPDYSWSTTAIPITITKKDVTLTLSAGTSTYGQTPVIATITGLVSGDSINTSFSGLVTQSLPTSTSNAGTYSITFNPSYTSANYNITNSPASVTWTINKANQTISFSPSTSVYTGSSQTLTASSSSGLPVSFSIISGPGSLSGAVLSYTGTGTVVVRASQSGNTNYNAASSVDSSITVTTPAPDISSSVSSLHLVFYNGYGTGTGGWGLDDNNNVVLNNPPLFTRIYSDPFGFGNTLAFSFNNWWFLQWAGDRWALGVDWGKGPGVWLNSLPCSISYIPANQSQWETYGNTGAVIRVVP